MAFWSHYPRTYDQIRRVAKAKRSLLRSNLCVYNFLQDPISQTTPATFTKTFICVVEISRSGISIIYKDQLGAAFFRPINTITYAAVSFLRTQSIRHAVEPRSDLFLRLKNGTRAVCAGRKKKTMKCPSNHSRMATFGTR